MSKYKQLYFEALSISGLKQLAEEHGLKVDIDKLVAKTISKKAEHIKASNASKKEASST